MTVHTSAQANLAAETTPRVERQGALFAIEEDPPLELLAGAKWYLESYSIRNGDDNQGPPFKLAVYRTRGRP